MRQRRRAPGCRCGRSQLTDERFDRVEALAAYAEERGQSLLDVAIGGLAAKRQVASVIAGATKPEQVEANVAAGEWVPTKDDLAALNKLRLSADRQVLLRR